MKEDRDQVIERAIVFLVESIRQSGTNPKPVILHSIRVGFCLLQRGYDTDLVVAGILHDLLEDSGATASEIEQLFGLGVRQIVEANTFDRRIDERRLRDIQLLKQCVDAGRNAMIVHAADILENLPYFSLASEETLFEWLVEKTGKFVDLSKASIGNEPIWVELNARFGDLKKQREKKGQVISGSQRFLS